MRMILPACKGRSPKRVGTLTIQDEAYGAVSNGGLPAYVSYGRQFR